MDRINKADLQVYCNLDVKYTWLYFLFQDLEKAKYKYAQLKRLLDKGPDERLNQKVAKLLRSINYIQKGIDSLCQKE